MRRHVCRTGSDIARGLYISIRSGDEAAVDSIDLEPGISADLDAARRVLGIEILDASEKTGESANVVASFELLGTDPVSVNPHDLP